jgi:hypothetical protein
MLHIIVSLLRGLTAVELYSIEGLSGKLFQTGAHFKKYQRYLKCGISRCSFYTLKINSELNRIVAFVLADWHSICYIICNVKILNMSMKFHLRHHAVKKPPRR